MDAQVLLSAIFRDPSKEGRNQFIKIWFLTARLTDWLLPDVRIIPITKGTVSYTFRRLPPRDMTLTLNMADQTYQYLGGSGKAALKALLQKARDDTGYRIHGHMVIVQLGGREAYTLDSLKQKFEIVREPNIGDGTKKPDESSSYALNCMEPRSDIVSEINIGDGTMHLNRRSPFALDSTYPRSELVPGPISGDTIIPRCGLMQGYTIPFTKILSNAVIKPSIQPENVSSYVSASSPEVKPELITHTAIEELMPDKTNDTSKRSPQPTTVPDLKPSKTQKALYWLAWGFNILKDSGVI